MGEAGTAVGSGHRGSRGQRWWGSATWCLHSCIHSIRAAHRNFFPDDFHDDIQLSRNPAPRFQNVPKMAGRIPSGTQKSVRDLNQFLFSLIMKIHSSLSSFVWLTVSNVHLILENCQIFGGIIWFKWDSSESCWISRISPRFSVISSLSVSILTASSGFF